MAKSGFIPDFGVPFRLVSASDGGIIAHDPGTQANKDSIRYTTPPEINDTDDGTYWVLTPGSKTDTYKICDLFYTDWSLYLNWDKHQIGINNIVIPGADDHDWKIYHDSGDLSRFKLFNVYWNVTLYVIPNGKGKPSSQSMWCTDNPYHTHTYFNFFFGNAFVKSVKFDLDKGQVDKREVMLAKTDHFENDTSIKQTNLFEVTYNETKSYTTETTSGYKSTYNTSLSITAEANYFSVAEISSTFQFAYSMESFQNWTEGTTTQKSETKKFSQPIEVAPGTKVECDFVITACRGTVPYTIVYGFEDIDIEFTSTGKCHVDQMLNVDLKMTETPLAEKAQNESPEEKE